VRAGCAAALARSGRSRCAPDRTSQAAPAARAYNGSSCAALQWLKQHCAAMAPATAARGRRGGGPAGRAATGARAWRARRSAPAPARSEAMAQTAESGAPQGGREGGRTDEWEMCPPPHPYSSPYHSPYCTKGGVGGGRCASDVHGAGERWREGDKKAPATRAESSTSTPAGGQWESLQAAWSHYRWRSGAWLTAPLGAITSGAAPAPPPPETPRPAGRRCGMGGGRGAHKVLRDSHGVVEVQNLCAPGQRLNGSMAQRLNGQRAPRKHWTVCAVRDDGRFSRAPRGIGAITVCHQFGGT